MLVYAGNQSHVFKEHGCLSEFFSAPIKWFSDHKCTVSHRAIPQILYHVIRYLFYIYRPRCEGDNVLGSVRLSVRPSVRPSVWVYPGHIIHHCYLALRSRAKVGSKSKVRVKGQGQRSGSFFWCAAVNIRDSSAVKSNKSHYQSKVFVCVSVISWCMWIIERMWSIGF